MLREIASGILMAVDIGTAVVKHATGYEEPQKKEPEPTEEELDRHQRELGHHIW
jgi:hypothetical protein